MPIQYPISQMDGAPWNILDASGCRIACCGGDSSKDCETFGPEIAAELIAKTQQAAYWIDRYNALERQSVDRQGEIDELRWAVANILMLCRRVARADGKSKRQELCGHAQRIAESVGCEIPGVTREE